MIVKQKYQVKKYNKQKHGPSIKQQATGFTGLAMMSQNWGFE
ncbi:MAG: hypothetical protein ACJAXM_001630 [Arenicella sp.]|jgi:hypothetical protein